MQLGNADLESKHTLTSQTLIQTEAKRTEEREAMASPDFVVQQPFLVVCIQQRWKHAHRFGLLFFN